MHTAYTSKVYGPPQLPDASLGSHSLTSRGAIALALSKPGQPVSQGSPLLTGEAFKSLIISSSGLLEEKTEEVSRRKKVLGNVEGGQHVGRGYLWYCKGPKGCRRWK